MTSWFVARHLASSQASFRVSSDFCAVISASGLSNRQSFTLFVAFLVSKFHRPTRSLVKLPKIFSRRLCAYFFVIGFNAGSRSASFTEKELAGCFTVSAATSRSSCDTINSSCNSKASYAILSASFSNDQSTLQ